MYSPGLWIFCSVLGLAVCGCRTGALRDSRADARPTLDGPSSGDALLTNDAAVRDARVGSDGDGSTPEPRIYWGAWISDNVNSAPFDYTSESDPGILGVFEARARKKVSLIHFGSAWENAAGEPIPFAGMSAALARIRVHGAIDIVDWGSWRAGGGTAQPEFELSRIAGGEYDAYVRAWAADARAYGYPFFLRLNPEMNGNWLPWGTKDGWNGNTNAEFVAAWRRIVDIFIQEEATNVTWVWCQNYVFS